VQPNIFIRVGTYVQRGSKFCFVVLVVGVTDIAQNTALLSYFAMHSALHSSLARQILHYYLISPCIQKYFEFRPISTRFGLRAHCIQKYFEYRPISTGFGLCARPAALPGSLDRQPFPAVTRALNCSH
jgi:hypothetical protein